MDENLPPITPTTFQESPKKNTRLIILVLTLIISAFVAGYYFIYQKPTTTGQNNQNQDITSQVVPTTTDQFSDWKTYINEEYGFEIKLPPDWLHFLQIDATPGNIAFKLPFEEIQDTSHSTVFNIEFGKKLISGNDLANIEANRPIYLSENKDFVFLMEMVTTISVLLDSKIIMNKEHKKDRFGN